MADRIWIKELVGESNYAQWKYDMSNLLAENDLLGHCDGSDEKPALVAEAQDADGKMKKWMMADRKAMGMIARTLSQQLHAMIRDCDSASGMWAKITGRFEATSEASVTDAWMNLFLVSFQLADGVQGFITKLNIAAEKLKVHKKDVDDSMKKGLLMRSLPLTFSAFRETYAGLRHAKQLDKIDFSVLCNMAIEAEERLRGLSAAEGEEQPTGSASGNALKAKTGISCFECEGPHFKRDCPRLKGKPKTKFKQGNKKKEETSARGFGGALVAETTGLVCFSAQRKDGWFLDSGASRHMTKREDWFTSLRVLKPSIPIRIGNDTVVEAIAEGDIRCESFDGNRWKKLTLENVLLVPDFGDSSLISMGMILDKGLDVIIQNNNIRVRNGRDVLVTAEREAGQLFRLQIRNEGKSSALGGTALAAKAGTSLQVWHERFSHASVAKIKSLIGKDVIAGLDVTDISDFFCAGCQYGKMVQKPFHSAARRDCKPGEILHSDLLDYEIDSAGGSKYILVIVDESSGYKYPVFLKSKGQAADELIAFIQRAENETKNKCLRLRTDNGTEFVNKHLSSFLLRKGIVHETSVPHVHQQCGMAERANRTIQEHVACLIHARNLPKFLWAEAARHVCVTLNRLPARKETDITPYEQWKGLKPDVSALRIWGSDAYGLVHPETRKGKKLAERAKKGIFVGYGNSLSHFKLYHPSDHKFTFYRDVNFNEEVTAAAVPVLASGKEDEEEAEKSVPREKRRGRQKGSRNFEKYKDQPLRRSKRNATVSTSTTAVPDDEDASSSASEIDEQKEPDDDISASEKEDDGDFEDCMFTALSAAAETDDIPRNYKEAVSGAEKEHWLKAMKSEMESHNKNKTWTLVPRPRARKVIKSRWVFSVKRKPDGSLIKYKARQVAKGFSQTEGVDYSEVFASVARASSIRTVLSLSAALNMQMMQFDVCTAFLYGDLEEEIYMEQPDGWTDGTDKVCALKKGLYGLKQASRQWNVKFSNFLSRCGLKQSRADPCVFTAGDLSVEMMLCLYVDDGLICCKTDDQMNLLIRALKKEFDITTGPVSCFIGMEIDQRADSIAIHQSGYIRKMLTRYGMADCKPAPTPAEPTAKLRKQTGLAREKEAEPMAGIPYREAIGSLMYASVISRPDIAFIVSKLAKFVDCPRAEHWTAAKRVFRYLKGTLDQKITYKRGCSVLTGFSDADWAGDLDSRRSTTGFVFMLNGGPVSWQSKTQQSVALSTLEAEYMAMSETTKECIWLRALIGDLGFEQKEKTSIKVDNQSALSLAENPEFHTRSKHIDIRYHFIRDEEVKGRIMFDYIASANNVADVFTKALTVPKFNICKNLMKLNNGLSERSAS